jgi:hypothetical protein
MRRAIGVGIVAALAIVATLGLPAVAFGQASEVVGAPVPPPGPDATGGPDGFGYTFIDSNEPGGPTYSWVDITGTGTAIVGLTDDNFMGPFAIGFSFPFYGVAQTQFYAGSNGFISFGAGSTSLSNQCPFPSINTPDNIIPMLWDDLNFSTSGTAYYQNFATCPVGTGACTVVEYSNVAHYGGVAGSAGTWEAILYPSGQILIQFNNPGTETGSGSTTGIEGPAATYPTYGLAYACDVAGSLAANLAVRFDLVGWTFTSADTANSGARGDVVNYTLTITNNEATARTYDITHTGNVWATSHPATVGPIASGASQDFTVTVTIPWTIGQCQGDAVNVSAADQSAPGSPKTIGLTTTGPGASVLYDNGPLVTHPGGGAGGADASAVQTALSMTLYGAGNQVSAGNRLADDFTVPAGETWTLDRVSFFEYQTGATTGASTFTATNYQIWNGAPNGGGAVIWGDTTTNRLASSAWSNIYRVLDTAMAGTTRPIMTNVCTGGAVLPAGTYWIDWQAAGSLSSGPWQPPISILGQTTTGNALQYTSTGWANLVDGTFQQGLPFRFSSCRPAADWGDAEGYFFSTLAADNGAHHLIPGPTAANAILGALIDADDDGQPVPGGAVGDDSNGLDDEDGVVFTSAIVPGANATVQVTATGATLLQAWIDFDGDGSWNGSSEQIFINQALVAGVNNLMFPVPVTAHIGSAMSRFRVSSMTNLGDGGQAPDGEVEDYLIATTPVELQSFVVE